MEQKNGPKLHNKKVMNPGFINKMEKHRVYMDKEGDEWHGNGTKRNLRWGDQPKTRFE